MRLKGEPMETGPWVKKWRLGAIFGLLLAVASGLCQPAAADEAREYTSQAHAFRAVTLVRDLEHPWSLAFLPDGRMLVSERPGRLRLIEANGRLLPEPLAGVPEVAAVGQGGLFDVLVHPNYPENGWIYLAYAGGDAEGYGTEVARARLAGNRLIDWQVLFRMRPKSRSGQHFGGRLVMDRQGFLYLTLGDRGDRQRAQKADDHAGSVIRLHDDGRLPQDNPFIGTPGFLPEKFTLGNRNIQGIALHPESGDVWMHEHGPQGGDEINVLQPGANYGWPVVTFGVNYGIGTRIGEGTEKPGMVSPLWVWVPSIAPSGMTFYSGKRFAGWRGSLFVGALRGQTLVRLEMDGRRVVREERLLENAVGRIRDVRQGPDGLLYLLTDSARGQLLRLEPR